MNYSLDIAFISKPVKLTSYQYLHPHFQLFLNIKNAFNPLAYMELTRIYYKNLGCQIELETISRIIVQVISFKCDYEKISFHKKMEL